MDRKPFWQHIVDSVVVAIMAGLILIPVARWVSQTELDRHIALSGGDIDARMLKQSMVVLQSEVARNNERIGRHCEQIHEIQDRLGIRPHGPGAEQRLRENANAQ